MHPALDNRSPFTVDLLFVNDDAGTPVVVPLVQATYRIEPRNALTLDDVQRPVRLGGDRTSPGDTSSWRLEAQIAFTKLATDVVLLGSARATARVTRESSVTFRVGPLAKTVRVVGDRTWARRLGRIAPSDPEPFERIPLTYERAFGGWDRGHADPTRHACEARNPAGVGFRLAKSPFEEDVRLPNLEDPEQPLRRWGDTPPPAAFAIVSPEWEPRRTLAGTYDDAWMDERMPLLPADFDRRFFNAASPGLVAAGRLTGGEPVSLRGTWPRDLDFRLPAVPNPSCTVVRRRAADAAGSAHLDTVIVDADAARLLLLWRGGSVPATPSDVTTVHVDVDGVPLHVH